MKPYSNHPQIFFFLSSKINLNLTEIPTHKTKSPWPSYFKHSHWWKRRSWSKFTSHYAWGTNGVCECKMDVKSIWVPTWHRMDHVSWSLELFLKPPLGSIPDTKPEDHGTPNTRNCWFILLYHVWGPTWIDIHWNSIWLKARSHMTSHYTWGSMITLHDFGLVLGWPWDTFFWALTNSWSRLLARVWSGPKLSPDTGEETIRGRISVQVGLCECQVVKIQLIPLSWG